MKRQREITDRVRCACFPLSLVLAACIAGPVGGAAEEPDDLDIALAVETQLIAEDAVPSHKIDVSTENRVVTLTGSVNTYYARLRAEDAAESVKGVATVVNRIEVEPVERLDTQVRSDIISALATDPVTDSAEIDVTVQEGVVTLTGEVDSYTEKMIAEQVAEQVKGVTSVSNLLTYEYAADRSDTELEAEVKQRLAMDASIDAGLITVSVEDGRVTLRGSVGSAAEKTEAATKVWAVSGVKSVANQLDVEWWARDEMSDWQDDWSSEETEQAIENALLSNPRVRSFEIGVDVDGGVATLTGSVDNLRARRAAEEEARNMLGIWRVKNYIRVRPPVDRTDSEIAENVREALRRSPLVDRYEIAVSVSNDKVYLTGEVDSWLMKQEAEQVAARVPGVVAIQNRLDIDEADTLKSDQEIKEDIEDQLWWSPFVDSDDITVEVEDGVATLRGTVDDWEDIQDARENAREGGAKSVISRLDVEYGIY